MSFDFPLFNVLIENVYVATFQQRLHMEYISFSWSDIPVLVVHIRMSLIQGYCLKWSYWTKSSLRKFYGRHHDLVNRNGTSVLQMTTDMFHLS